MKKFWKVLGLGALAAGLTPYKVEKNEETGENSYQALLWRITSAPSEEEGEKRRIDINLGEGTLTSKLIGAMEKKEEPHLFSDELSVEYHAGDAADAIQDMAEKAADMAEDVAEKAADAAEEAAEKAGDLVEKAVEKAEDAAKEAAEAVEKAID